MPLSHSDVVKPRGTALLCPNLGAIWREVFKVTAWVLYPGKNTDTHWRRLAGPQGQYGESCVREKPSPPPWMEPGPSSLWRVAILTTQSLDMWRKLLGCLV